MEASEAKNQNGELCVQSPMSPEEFDNLVQFFRVLLEIDLASRQKDVQRDLNSEVLASGDPI